MVEKLCRVLGVKIIRSFPYHPQSQGKVERSHRSLRKKITFDLLNLSNVGVNWAYKLREYQKLLNNKLVEVLGNHSPFEVFFGRTSNVMSQRVKDGQCYAECSSNSGNVNPKERDFEKRQRKHA